MPCLGGLHDRLLHDDQTISDDALRITTTALETTLAHIHLLVRLALPESVFFSAPEDTLLCELSGLRRHDLEATLAKALEPHPAGLRDVLAAFVGPLPLPIIGDVRVLARELVDGLTIGEVRRRAATR